MEMDSALKFELEIKKDPAKYLGQLLVKGSYKEFEDATSRKFINHLYNSIYLPTCFTDWLIYFLRPRHTKPKQHLVTSYLQKYFLTQANLEKLEFYRLLQFISFVRSYSGRKEIVNGQTYVVVVGTPKNLLKLMANEKSDFLSPGDPIVIVKKMTKEVVEEAIQAYAEDDAYYLKFYSGELDTKTLDVLKNRSIAREKFLDHLIEKGESIDDIENYDLIDFNINKA